MYFSKTNEYGMRSSSGQSIYFNIPVKCKCGNSPAVAFTADCHGDSETLCKECWKKWFDNELMPVFDRDFNEDFEVMEKTPEMEEKLPWLKNYKEAIYKRKK